MHKTCYKQYRKNKCGNGKISREGREREKWTNKYGAHCPSFATVCGPVTVNCNCVSGTLTVNAAGRVKIVGRNGKSGCRRLCPCFARASSWPTYCCCCVSLPIPLSLFPFVLGCFVFSFVGCFSNFVCRAFVDILQHLLHSKVFVATLFFLFWPQTAAVQLAPSNLLDRARKGGKDREAAARRNRENFADQLAMALKWTSRNCNYCVTQIRIARFVFLSALSLSARFAAVFTFPLACNVV